MSQSTKAFLDDVPLEGAITWQFSDGVEPFRTLIILSKDKALAIIGKAKDKPQANPYFTLTLEPGSSSVQENQRAYYSNIVLVTYEPTEDPRFYSLEIADNRIFWSRPHFRGDFNIRDNLGNKEVVRRLDGGSVVLEEFGGKIPLDVLDRIQYRTYSLYPPLIDREATDTAAPWTVSQMLTKVLNQISENIPYALDLSAVPSDLKKIQFIDEVLKENIELNGPAHSCLHQILELVPNVGIFVDEFGAVRFYSKSDGGEDKVLKIIDYAHQGSKIPIYVDNKFFIPEYIEVLFDAEVEVRFDYTERDDLQTTISNAISGPLTATPLPAFSEERALENIIQVPDPSFLVFSTFFPSAYTVLSGQYINFDEYILSLPFNTSADFLALGIPITKPFIREMLLNGLTDGYLGYLTTTGDAADLVSSWQRRAQAIQECYRRKFRINPFWKNRMTNIQANMVSYISTTEPLRAPSPVYMDYCKKLTYKGARAFGTGDMMANVLNYAEGGELTDMKPCPWASVNFIGAEENSVFDISLRADPYGHNQAIIPGKVANVPNLEYGRFFVPHCYDDWSIVGGSPGGPIVGLPNITTGALGGIANSGVPAGSLSKDHDMTIIITATPVASPGVKLFGVKVYPKDMDRPQRFRYTGAKGPPMQVKVDPSTQTLRVVWSDDKAKEIEEVFGVRRDSDGALLTAQPDYAGLETNMENLSHVQALAKQVATEHYGPYLPRFRGALTTNYNPTLYPNGTIGRIAHTVSGPSGKLSTTAMIDDQYVSPSWIQLLPMSIRAVIQKFVKKG